jgi:hypothetical protein
LNRVECADKTFLTCRALHNWLLETDGLSTSCNNGIPTIDSKWDGPLGEHHPEDNCIIPQAICNIHNPVAMRTFDLSGMGPGSGIDEADNVYDNAQDNPSHRSNQGNDDKAKEQAAVLMAIRNLSLADFRKRLITHFDIAYQRREIKWPSAKNTPYKLDIDNEMLIMETCIDNFIPFNTYSIQTPIKELVALNSSMSSTISSDDSLLKPCC